MLDQPALQPTQAALQQEQAATQVVHPVPRMAQAVLRQQPSAAPAFPDMQDYVTPDGMWRGEFRAMGTTISLLLPVSQFDEGMHIVRSLFTRWEQTLSRFLPESELSRLNRHTGMPVVVSDLLYTVLTTALEAAWATEGAYDPAMLEQLERLGYDRTFDEVSQSAGIGCSPIFACGQGGGWRGIQVDAARKCVFMPDGLKLDFGGIAKGMAVDAAIERLRRSGIDTALVNAGGDLAVLGLPAGMSHWPIAVPGRNHGWTLPLLQGAIGTSGIARRHWVQGNTVRHHLLDPRTGLPARSDLWSVTVVTDRCEQAEIAAKVAFILGSQQGADFLREYAIAGLLVREDGTWKTVEPMALLPA